MFIETLEFTIPVELCSVFSNLQKGQRSNVEFPASVNSYGTTQDANIQVVLRSNKLTFKVDGVSSNASMISKSECKTLKLSVFDVDHTLMPQEEEQQVYSYNNDMSTMQHTMTMSVPTKRLHEQSVSLPPAKSSRTSYSESPRPRSPAHRRSQSHTSPRPSENSQSKSHNDTPVNVKQEPEDPDLIEIEPDDIVPKKETPYMQIDYSSNVPHTQTSQAALDRVSHPQSSHSQSPASSSSSFHQNVPHVPDYSGPGPSHHGDQSADDFLVFQDENEDGDDNEADYSNDDYHGSSYGLSLAIGEQGGNSSDQFVTNIQQNTIRNLTNSYQFGSLTAYDVDLPGGVAKKVWPCAQCDKVFANTRSRRNHIAAIHEKVDYVCVCGKWYTYHPGLIKHQKACSQFRALNSQARNVETNPKSVQWKT